MKIAFFLSLLVFLSGCSWRGPAPVSSVTPDYTSVDRGSYRGSYYEVKKGDTLYYIAYITDRDIDDIIEHNDLQRPYTIYPGQTLALWKPAYQRPDVATSTSSSSSLVSTPASSAASVASATNSAASASVVAASSRKSAELSKFEEKNKSKTATERTKSVESGTSSGYSQTKAKSKKNVNKRTASSSNQQISWQWPTRGRMVSRFSSTERGNKGIDIAGQRGQGIQAAADGKVVYAGSALRGYGKLIIVKHNDDYLSAYAHNDRFYVSEGRTVKKGQKIASMGSSGANSVRLHFEIRYKGKSVNPLHYLPKR
ncbi:peptidoglycan DD-metalloendopeptidase family protein [Salinivibrio sp. ES.052]|uniref:peptidoglycan DD-metalloendopeptidase family protein n=1 Tax=Salinivibrio sp. ES.052 TaxID=1882823 RepID=UPI00092755BB|nr:peptidoglycan DD-metalloendopeptidase family protein [Salinivibrio sp. ES.052]SIO02790.1 lipoprotein NlpD [Salinivibrio sp. ES.052]